MVTPALKKKQEYRLTGGPADYKAVSASIVAQEVGRNPEFLANWDGLPLACLFGRGHIYQERDGNYYYSLGSRGRVAFGVGPLVFVVIGAFARPAWLHTLDY